MAKLTHTDLTNIIGAETAAIAAINANGALTETAMENTLSRDGTTPNTMSADLDMNTKDVNNVGTLRADALLVNGNALATAGIVWLGAWVTATVYAVDAGVSNQTPKSSYICILAHTAASINEPGVGANTATFWDEIAGAGATGAAGGNEKEDNVFRVIDNSDNTKKLAFSVGGITTGTVRTWTVSDENITFGNFADTLLNSSSEANFKANVNLEAGTDFNAFDASLADIANISFARGDIIYQNATDLVRLAAGTSGQFLQTKGSGANPVWAGGGWTEIASATVGTVSQHDVTGISGFRTVRILFDLKPVTDGVNFQLRVGHSSTTFLTSGVYDGSNQFVVSGAVGNAAGEYISGQIDIHRFNVTDESTLLGTIVRIDAAGADQQQTTSSLIDYTANALTAIRLFFSSGNISGGRVTVLGLI